MNRTTPGRHGRSRPDACSVLWDNAQASARGTAPLAKFWVAVEQNGPWGRQAATQSHLDPGVGRALDQMCQATGGRLVLIRRPGTHSDTHPALEEGRHQRIYLAGGLARRPWLLEADLDDPARVALLTQLDGEALGSGDLASVQDSLPELRESAAPVLLICTNSRRDVCCALRGRPVALEAASQRPGRVWECSHTGGHRFAPTGVLLPHGQTFARLWSGAAVGVLDASDRGKVPAELLGTSYDRGRSHLDAPGQAAESFVREQIQETSLLGLSTTAAPRTGQQNAWQCRVSHVDGRNWDVVAAREPCEDQRPESCGKAPVPTWAWTCTVD